MKVREFKMKEVVFKKVLVWNPDCMTKRPAWVAILGGEWIATDDTKAELIRRVREYRRKAKA